MGEIDPRLPVLPGSLGAGMVRWGTGDSVERWQMKLLVRQVDCFRRELWPAFGSQSQGPKVRPGEADPGLRARHSAPALPARAGSTSTSRPQPPSRHLSK